MGRDPGGGCDECAQPEDPGEETLTDRAETAEERPPGLAVSSPFTDLMYAMMSFFSCSGMIVSGKEGMDCGPVCMAS